MKVKEKKKKWREAEERELVEGIKGGTVRCVEQREIGESTSEG